MDKETLIKEALGKQEVLGCGKFVIKAALKKATKSQGEQIKITVELTPDYQKDYEPGDTHTVCDSLLCRTASTDG